MFAGPHARGVALCVLSACGFGAMAIFAKQAYAAGFAVADLLSLRLVAAAACLWALALAAGRSPLALPRRTALLGFGLGAVLFALQARLYFGALERIDASLTALLLYTYPALVLLAALALGRERATRRRTTALGLACAGTLLVLAGGGTGATDALGVAMALGASVSYATYLLISETVLDGADPLALAATILTGAAVSLTAAAVAAGGPDWSASAAGYGWVGAIVAISTVGGVLALFAGMRLVGAATASILSTAEPVVTVLLAAAVFGEALGPWQAAGGALVLSAVVVLQRRADSVRRDDAPADARSPAAAGTAAHQPA